MPEIFEWQKSPIDSLAKYNPVVVAQTTQIPIQSNILVATEIGRSHNNLAHQVNHSYQVMLMDKVYVVREIHHESQRVVSAMVKTHQFLIQTELSQSIDVPMEYEMKHQSRRNNVEQIVILYNIDDLQVNNDVKHMYMDNMYVVMDDEYKTDV